MRIDRIFLLGFLYFSISDVFGYISRDSLEIEIIKDKIETINEKISDISTKTEYHKSIIDTQNGLIDTAFDGVSSQLGSSSVALSIFAIILTIGGIVLTVYVSRIESSVREMTSNNESLLQQAIDVRTSIEDIYSKVTSDASAIYKMMKDEETKAYIERLVAVPEDIVNLSGILASRDLKPDYFESLRHCFFSVEDNADYRGHYSMVLFQHYPYEIIIDEEACNLLFKDIESCVSGSFKNDILKSSFMIFKAFRDRGIEKSITPMNSYVTELTTCKFNKLDDLFNSIVSGIESFDDKLKMFQLILSNDDNLDFRRRLLAAILASKPQSMSTEQTNLVSQLKLSLK